MAVKGKITEQDFQILRWINRFGFATAKQIMAETGRGEKAIYHRLLILKNYNLLVHDEIFKGMPGTYRLTQAATELVESELSAPKMPSLGTYKHDLGVVDLYLALRAKLSITEADIKTEREMRKEKGFKPGSQGHIPDFLIYTPNGTIAIELELTPKSTDRRAAIMREYSSRKVIGDLTEVWYYCPSGMSLNAISKTVKEQGLSHFVKLYNIKNLEPVVITNTATAQTEPKLIKF